MNYKTLYKTITNILNVKDSDKQTDTMIRNCINDTYCNDLSRIDKRISASYLPVVNGVITFPDDYIDTENITPFLSNKDKKVGNSVIIADSTKSSSYRLIYSCKREDLTNDTDELDIDSSLLQAIISRCCYVYTLFQKDSQTANQYLNDYNAIKNNYIMNSNDYSEESVADVYSTSYTDD